MNDGQIEKLIHAFEDIGRALHRLGTNNASSQMGAIEFLAKEIMEGSDKIQSSLESISESISTHGE